MGSAWSSWCREGWGEEWTRDTSPRVHTVSRSRVAAGAQCRVWGTPKSCGLDFRCSAGVAPAWARTSLLPSKSRSLTERVS